MFLNCANQSVKWKVKNFCLLFHRLLNCVRILFFAPILFTSLFFSCFLSLNDLIHLQEVVFIFTFQLFCTPFSFFLLLLFMFVCILSNHMEKVFIPSGNFLVLMITNERMNIYLCFCVESVPHELQIKVFASRLCFKSTRSATNTHKTHRN